MAGLSDLQTYLRKVATELEPAAQELAGELAEAARVAAKDNIHGREGPRYDGGAGPGFAVQPGFLGESLHVEPSTEVAGVYAAVMGTDVVYSRIQELGGTVEANGHCGGDGVHLVFKSYTTGQFVSVGSVELPAKHYMERAYLETSLEIPARLDAMLEAVMGV